VGGLETGATKHCPHTNNPSKKNKKKTKKKKKRKEQKNSLPNVYILGWGLRCLGWVLRFVCIISQLIAQKTKK